MNVYFNEYNIRMGAFSYLPLVSGLLRSYAETFPEIRDAYRFMPFIYAMDTPENILKQYTEPPDIACFSSLMWNEQLNYRIAREVKAKYPDCLIVFGGPNVPMPPQHDVAAWMQQHPYIDLAVRAEGEEPFADILKAHAAYLACRNIPGVAYRLAGRVFFNDGEREFNRDMPYPSPYLDGYYDDLLTDGKAKGHQFQAIIETNRGCPFPCTFCIAKGTLIDTPSGKVPIEKIRPGDSVVSFDEHRRALSTSKVRFSLRTGVKKCVKIIVSNKELHVTEEHRVFTPDGWREAGTLRKGDEVLLAVQESNSLQGAEESALLLQPVLAQVGREARTDSTGFQGRQVRSVESRPLGANARRQSHASSRSGEASSCDAGSVLSIWENGSISGNHGGPNTHFKDCACACIGTGQSIAESYDMAEGSSGGMSVAEWAGAKDYEFFGEERTAVSIHGEFHILGGSVRIGEVSESRLRNDSSETSHSGARQVLASGSGERSAGDSGLREQGLALLHHLGFGSTGLGHGCQNPSVCWQRIESIEPSGQHEVYDLVNVTPHSNFFANGILVHNCYWGRGGLSRKYRFKDLERVKAEIDWMGQHQIRYVFNADSNFGMNPRDREIADYIVETKQRYGFPEKFRTCFGKNTDERIFQIGALFHQHQLEKGITLARQSNDATTLDNIKRSNIKMATYVNLQTKFNDINVPVYSEMILGLPGETLESWLRGIDELLEAGIKNQLFVYLCQVLTNTEMAESDYREKFGLETKRIKLAEIHGEARPTDFVQEYEEIIIGTASMPHEDWKDALRFSYVMMLFHSLKIAYYLLIVLLDRYRLKMSAFIAFVASRRFTVKAPLMTGELDFYDGIIARMVQDGEHRGTVIPEYGDIYWDVEEASFLRLTQDTDALYNEMTALVAEFLGSLGINAAADSNLMAQAVRYQQARIPSQSRAAAPLTSFDWNFPDYFDRRFSSSPVPLERKWSWMKVTPTNWEGDLKRFAKESILWGRKSGTMLTPVSHSRSAVAA